MEGDKELAQRYRKRADEVRGISATMTDPNYKKILDEVATDYEQMAQRLEEIHHQGRRQDPQISN
jgi:hypothetical protein